MESIVVVGTNCGLVTKDVFVIIILCMSYYSIIIARKTLLMMNFYKLFLCSFLRSKLIYSDYLSLRPLALRWT
jgi:hypothetical protein